ncbi:MAG: metal-sensitive transcriptional regulator [Candidatus Aminicenantes bacterium]|nr:metal-sensitive transcriptional regulator [Candidatus Aminicenantes bacterium]
MNETHTTHEEELVRLRRIEGQIRGIQKMISEGRYCIDILTQLSSVTGAIRSVEDGILRRHLEGCVQASFSSGDSADRTLKIEEVIGILQKFRKN